MRVSTRSSHPVSRELTFTLKDMLTPIDQPLDKLEDLTTEEMYVLPEPSAEPLLT